MPLQEAIKISTDTKSLLDNLKIVEMDTYDAVIKRLIGHYAEGMTDINKETKDLLLQQIRRINEGKVKSFNQVLKEFKNMKKKRTYLRMIKVLKARNQFEIKSLVDDYIEVGYVLRTNIYKCWYAPQETKWRAKVEAPKGALESRLDGQKRGEHI